MNNRERALAVLNYQHYDRLPLVHFGFWHETLDDWAAQGHISREEARDWADGNAVDDAIGGRLGFDFNWSGGFYWSSSLRPGFERKLVRAHPGGGREILNEDGVVVVEKDDAGSIPSEVEHLLKDRKSWEEHYLPRLQWEESRVDWDWLANLPEPEQRDRPLCLWCGSLWGRIRDIAGVVGLSYLMSDDPELVDEMVRTTADLCYTGLKAILERYDRFDYGHMWEDICFKNGPLVSPRFFAEKIGPHYRRITDLLREHGISIVSLDCDGKIDKLAPIWIENGVNTMFPIEVGTWNANIAPWRAAFGRELRGVGGMNKVVFAQDKAAINTEVERLKPLVELGGFIPCVDHRIPPDAKWENVQYYCQRMCEVFG
ncbi:MAG: hypothetical protein JW987_01515 [Anaerolineaceae bacterium]|nr:hypothetical protein [Anaerolineaceae bacterium]